MAFSDQACPSPDQCAAEYALARMGIVPTVKLSSLWAVLRWQYTLIKEQALGVAGLLPPAAIFISGTALCNPGHHRRAHYPHRRDGASQHRGEAGSPQEAA